MTPDTPFSPILSNGVSLIFKSGFVIIAVLYFIFSLIIVRQVFLMTETLVTEVSPLIRIFAILHAIAALLVVVYFITTF